MAGRAFSDAEPGVHLVQERYGTDFGIKLNDVFIRRDFDFLCQRMAAED